MRSYLHYAKTTGAGWILEWESTGNRTGIIGASCHFCGDYFAGAGAVNCSN